MSEYLADIADIRQRMHEHHQRGLFTRAGHIIIGMRPSSAEREALRRYDLGISGRVKENIFDAIYWSRKVRQAPLAIPNDLFLKALLSNNSLHTTLPIPLEPETGPAGAVQDLLVLPGAIDTPANQLDAMGFFVRHYNRRDDPHFQAAHAEHIGILAFRDNVVVDAARFSSHDIRDLPRHLQQDIELLSFATYQYAEATYLDAIPDQAA
jgi:hypothetical protein